MVTLQRWRSLDTNAAARYAALVADAVGAELVEVGYPDSPSRRERLPRFDVAGELFVLIPGGVASLGYDARRFVPTAAELASFLGDYDALRSPDDDEGQGGLQAWVPVLPGQLELFPAPVPRSDPPTHPPVDDVGALRQYLTARLTPPRTTTVPTLLVAVEAVTAGLTEVSVEHPLIAEHLRAHPWARGTLGWFGDFGKLDDDPGTYARIEFDRISGQVTRCWTAAYAAYDDIVSELAGLGRRLLTPDEWEYAYAFGPTTLFAWGDRFDASDRHALETVTGLHRGDMTWPELTSARAEVRGGDFGRLGCGGETTFFHLLLRAPAFRDPDIIADEKNKVGVRRRRYRPAIEVSPIAA